jgi:hypothetical protein
MRPLNWFLAFCVLLLTSGLAAGQCAPCTVWSASTTPTVTDSGEAAGVELGLKFRADVNGYVTGVRFYKSVSNSGTHIGNLWSASGSKLASATFVNETASGWQQVSFNPPVQISPATTYVVSYYTSVGHYAFGSGFFAGTGVDNAPLHALANGVDGGNGVYAYGAASSFPSNSYNSSNYWVDVTFIPQGSTVAPVVTGTFPANGSGGADTNIAVTAIFSEPMDSTSINTGTFQLTDAVNNAVPGTVSYVAATQSLVCQPNASLVNHTSYNATVRGSVKDIFGNALGSDFTWTFTTVTTPPLGVCPCSIWGPTSAPITADSGEATGVEVGVKFTADLDGFVTGIRFFKSAANSGTHIGNLWTAAGVKLGSATFTGESASGWQQVTFASPIAVTAGTTYVASYFTSAGRYAFDVNGLNTAVDNSPLHALASAASGGNGVYAYGSSSRFPNASYNSANYWVDLVYVPKNSTAAPFVSATTPSNGSTGISMGSKVSARFSVPMDPSTIIASAFQLVDSSDNAVSGSVSYSAPTSSLVFQPNSLIPLTTYIATVRGTVRDTFGNAMGTDSSWSFTTAAPPPDSGPGGPILVIANTDNPFSHYYGEILSAEGMNEFRIKDISTITPTVLAQYDIAILGDLTLTSNQVSMLTTWVNGGGNLIAMHPDPQLASLLGLASTGSSLANGYLAVNTGTAPGAGIVASTIQFHGSADLYVLSGATKVATIYNDSTTATTSPAVTLNTAGSGQAAAFTYDLARSVVYTRQGNPAWSGQDRDGYVDPAQNVGEIRANDLFYGNASFDPQPDWVNLSKVQIPQADEQQRLLVNLIQQMNRAKKPLPRFWYLPSGFKAAVVMTGDNHYNDETSTRFDQYIAASPTRCSVPDWACVRATSYIWPNNVFVANYQSYVAQGFEIANHADNIPSCSTFTPTSLDAALTSQLAAMALNYSGLPPSQTNRTHCVLWSDYDSEPQLLLNHGIRLDTTYYYWPDIWVQGRTGLFTGSGLPMRYADRNGNTIDVYQATTQLPDETTSLSYPAAINTLLDNAIGAPGYYAVITTNDHTDYSSSPESDAVVASAQARGVPVVSALQMLQWLDGRNSSSFGSVSWGGNTLSFTISIGTGARNLRAMLPINSNAGPLTNLTLAGVPVTYTTQIIKGMQYAFFAASAGSYQATYGVFSISGTISGTGGNSATVTLSGPASATVTATTSGTYIFTGLTNGAYTVTPSKAGFAFTPASRNVTISNSNVGSVNFTSAALAPLVQLSPTSLAFGSITVGTPSTARAVTLSNIGTATLTLTSITIAGTNPGDFTQTNNCGPSLGIGANCTINVTFTPAVAGSRSGSLRVTDNASGSPQSVSLTGTGLGPAVTLSPTSIAFPVTLDFATAATQTVTVRNSGTTTVTISSIALTGTNASEFAIASNTCGTTLAASASCAVGITFRPQVAAVRSASITVTDNAPGSPHSASLSGTGTMVAVSPGSLSFASQLVGTISASQNVTVSNVGPGTLTVTSISIIGTNPSDFTQTNTCGSTLTSGTNCTVNVKFTPKARFFRRATLSIADSDLTSPETVTLTGTGQ